jgi:hypothetical protein
VPISQVMLIFDPVSCFIGLIRYAAMRDVQTTTATWSLQILHIRDVPTRSVDAETMALGMPTQILLGRLGHMS